MQKKTAKLLGVFFSVLFLIAAAWAVLCTVPYFDVSEVEVNVLGPVSGVPADAERVISPLKGRNIFTVRTAGLRRSLSSCMGVKNADVRKFYPGRLIITLDYGNVLMRAFTENGFFYLGDAGGLYGTEEDVWLLFDVLPAVELNFHYADMVEKWGADQGFAQMLELVSGLGERFLITSIKYDNNNNNGFGQLMLRLGPLNAEIWVHDPVTSGRLEEAFDFVKNEEISSGAAVRFDLYSNAIVRRI